MSHMIWFMSKRRYNEIIERFFIKCEMILFGFKILIQSTPENSPSLRLELVLINCISEVALLLKICSILALNFSNMLIV